MQEWCVAIREARARYQVPPRERIEVRLQADGATADVLRATEALLANMAGLASTTVGPDQERTKDSATVVLGDSKAFLVGVVDLDKEKQKLQKEQKTLEGKIGGLERKLSNEGFLAKAPAAVVEKERAALDAFKVQLQGVQQSLSELE